jgi:hypothetical protein
MSPRILGNLKRAYEEPVLKKCLAAMSFSVTSSQDAVTNDYLAYALTKPSSPQNSLNLSYEEIHATSQKFII